MIFIQEIRKSVLILLASIVIATLLFYTVSPRLFNLLQEHLHQKLVFFTVAEPFLAHLKLSFGLAIFTLVPMTSLLFWQAMTKPFKLSRWSRLWFICFTCLLFYSGAAFCYFITLPYGIKFLLGYESKQIQPIISAGHFVNFVGIFILGFGLIFELPIGMVFSGKAHIVPRQVFEKNRRYAVLIISIIAAVLTPTPDIFNMMLMGLPLYALYETGIIVMKILRI
ncbi:MAG: preprotein translocase subunit TatC [Deltaproteobacteria bacterium]|nr:preprotein translocase subunit TatC [Deltaproteobacteria bacterium]